jgi:hypothetical protein
VKNFLLLIFKKGGDSFGMNGNFLLLWELGLGIGHIGPVNRVTDYRPISYRLTDS